MKNFNAIITEMESFLKAAPVRALRAIFFITCLLVIFLSNPALAQQASVNASLIEFVSRDENNCTQTSGGLACNTFMQYHLDWSKSAAFPYSPPSPIGYWTGFVFMHPSVGPSTIIGGPSDYVGRAFLQTTQGSMTIQQMQNVRNAMINANWQAFSNFFDSQGMQIVINSSNATVGAQDIGDLAWAQEPVSAELIPRAQHNAACAGDPVYLNSGQFYYQCNDLSIPGRNLDVGLSHTYFSGLSFNGPFGYGWLINYYMRLHVLRSGNAVIVSGDGRKTEYTFSAGTYTPPAGRFEALVKNVDNSWTLTLSQGEKYEFDTSGKLTAIKDRNSNTISFAYDPAKQPHYGRSAFGQNPLNSILLGSDWRLTQITDTNNRVISLNYNALTGLLESFVDNIPGGGTRVVAMSYDPVTNDLLAVTKPATAQYPSGVAKSFEYQNHNVKKIKDAKGQYFVENFYDAEGRVEEQNLGGASMTFDYSVPNQVTEADRKGYVTRYNFNAGGNVVTKTEFTTGLRAGEPASYVTAYSYNSDSLQTSVTLPKGNGSKFSFDSANTNPRARGNLLQIRRKTNMAVADNDTNDIMTNMAYEAMFNQVDSITDPKGNVTAFTYDYELPTNDPKYALKGNPIFIDQPQITTGPYPGVPTTEFTYNASGQVTEVVDPNTNRVTYDYHAATGYLQHIYQDPSGINATTTFTYDNFGNLDIVMDAENHATNYDYDELGWLRKVTNPLNFATNYFHDANGNVARIERQASDPAGTWQITEFTYDILNHLKTVEDPLNRVTTYNYDNNENLASVVDAETNTTTNVYDERDKLFTVTDANTPAGVTRYDYDINGNLAKITDAESNATNYTYDLFDRLDIQTYADLSLVNYDYDKNSNLDFVTLPGTHGTIDYVYDALNQMTNKNFPSHTSLNTTYTYDLAGRMKDANNAAVQIGFDYDALNRVDNITNTYNLTPYTLDYSYDKAGNRTQLVYPSTKMLDYVFDANNRLDIIKLNTVNFADYDYDPLDRRTQKQFLATSPQSLATYSYDIANQLTSVTNTLVNATAISQYAYPVYDNVGNRKQLDRTLQTNPVQTTNYNYNDIYELTGVSGAQTHSYDYDGVANREVADSVIYTPNNLNQYTNVGGTAYGYDSNGNLTRDGTNSYTFDEQNRLSQAVMPGPVTATYTYDALNRRVSKIVGATTTYFIYDGDDVVAEYDGTGALLAENILGDSVDEMLAMERGANTYYYHMDGLGSVTEITDSTGTIVENYTYDPYGMPSVINSAIGNRYRFTGREFDEESGLSYYRHRTLDHSIGRFVQRDPLGYYDSMNLFSYTVNNPVNFTDPLGLEVYLAGHAVMGVGGHVAIILVPNNESDFQNDPRFSRNPITGKLEADVSAGSKNGILTQYPYDADRITNEGMKSVFLKDSKGRSDTQFIRDILTSTKGYNNKLSYDPFAFGGAYNSNSYIRGLLKGAGVESAELPGWYWYPGWDKPIPIQCSE